MTRRFDDEEDETPTVVFQIIVKNEPDDDTKTGGARPNAYWQRIREAEEALQEPDTFGGGFRGVRPAPHGGQATVKPEEVIGSDEDCWCGLPAGHDWPGKDRGRKHPKEAAVNTKIDTSSVDRRDLRAYHARLQDFIIQCVNEDGLRYRLGKNSAMLYPPDGSNPATVYARNSDRQVKQLQKWYATHVWPHVEADKKIKDEAVEAAALAKLAERINDPNEHPVAPKKRVDKPAPAPVAPKAETEKTEPKVEAPKAEPKAEREPDSRGRTHDRESIDERKARSERNHQHTPGVWRPYEREQGPSPHIETDGKQIRCALCEGGEHPLLTDNPRSIGGHNRIYHTNAPETLWAPDVRAKAIETQRQTKMKVKIEAAANILMDVLGEDSPAAKLEALTKQVATLTRENEALKAKVEKGDNSAKVAALTKRAEEAEARLALMREALSA